MDTLRPLPNSYELSPHILQFLDEHFKTQKDLPKAPTLLKRLQKECGDLDGNLVTLQKKLSSMIATWVSRSHDITSTLHQLSLNIANSHLSLTQGDLQRTQGILCKELPLLVQELRRIETVRAYAETTLRLEALVGDLEDAVSSVVNRRSRNIFSLNLSSASNSTDIEWKQEKLLVSVKAMSDTEEALVRVIKFRPQWARLIDAVDSRVDKALAVLRPQALADHRALIASLGWPPPLSAPNLDKGESSEVPNPLVLMKGHKMEKYSHSFLALCSLQHFQTRREARQHGLVMRQLTDLKESGTQLCLFRSLWTIEELVSPLTSRTEHHFARWSEHPEFMFTLVYKIARDFIGGVDDVLQPLIDKARLVGCSAKEAWVSAMVNMLSQYLTKSTFPLLAERYHDANGNSEVASSWLHLVDLAITFNKQMQALASAGTSSFSREQSELNGISRGMSVLSIFCDQSDWLEIWAEIELKDAKEKLNFALSNEKSWMFDVKHATEFVHNRGVETFLLTTREEYKAPLIVESIIRITWVMIQRCRTLPSTLLQAQFIRTSASKLLLQFFDLLLQRCPEIESMSPFIGKEELLRVASSINAIRYCEFVLRQWSEDINFLEMSVAEDVKGKINDHPDLHSCFFGNEIQICCNLETDLVEEIMSALLWQFNSLSWDYVENKRQWEQECQGDFDTNGIISAEAIISLEFVEALDTLKDQLLILKMALNSKDFLDLWRSIASGLDHFIFSSILLSNTNFSSQGINQFIVDMQALFLIFQHFCARAEAFFPFICNSLKLLSMGCEDVKHLQALLSKGDKKKEYLQLHGIYHISCGQAEKILRNRKFGG